MVGQGAGSKRSTELGRRALELIERHNVSADPASYAVWYAFVSESNPALHHDLEGILANKGRLSDEDVDDVRRRHLPGLGTVALFTTIGEKLSDEADQIVGMIVAAIGVTAGAEQGLSAATRKLAAPIDRETLRGIIEAVLLATKEVQQQNTRLGDRLKKSHEDISDLQEHLAALRNEALTDGLTGLANRRHFDQRLSSALLEAERGDKPLSLLILDVDHFKAFNDAHGHQFGDQILRLIASVLLENTKGQDIAARYGGEEFAIILPKTKLPDALALAESLRAAVAAREIVKRPTGEKLGRVTVSIGVAERHRNETAQALIEAADTCLYAAKKRGRNRAVSETDLG